MLNISRRWFYLMLGFVLIALPVVTIKYRQYYLKISADVVSEDPAEPGLSPNARSYFKLFTLLHDGSRYTNSFEPNKVSWLQAHVDEARTLVPGDASYLNIPVSRYTNWRDFNTVDNVVFSFENLLTYYQERQKEVDDAFVHVASDTFIVRNKDLSRPLPSMNDRLQRVFKVSSLPNEVTTLPEATDRQDITRTVYGDQQVPNMPHDFTLTVGDSDTHYILMGHNWKFDELNFNVTTPASSGWQTRLEYWSGTDWLPLTTISDTTNNFSQSGKVRFFPPSNWSSSKLPDELAAYYWVRLSDFSMNGSTTLTAHKIQETNKKVSPATDWDGIPAISLTPYNLIDYSTYPIYRQIVVIPGWDASNDINQDGYLSDEEYDNRPNKQASARFRYQSRLPATYLRGRWEANYADPTYQQFAKEQTRLALSDTGTSRAFVDNAYTTLMLPMSLTYPDPNDPSLNPNLRYLEYENDAALQQSAVDFLAALHGPGVDYILINGSLGQPITIPSVEGVMLENEITYPHSVSQEDPDSLALFWNQLKVFSDAGKDIIVNASGDPSKNGNPGLVDLTTRQWLPEGWRRHQMYSLARYYLTATPRTYYWIQSGSPWNSWFDIMSRDLGEAEGDYRLVSTDQEHHSYVYRRDFTLGSVLLKTMATNADVAPSIDDDTKYFVDLSNAYYPLDVDNNIQSRTTSVDIRNYEGIILLKDQPPVIDPINDVVLVARASLDQRVTAIDPEGASVDITANNLPNGATFELKDDGYHLRWQPTPRSVAYSETITIRANDGNNQVELSFTITVPANEPPIFGIIKNDNFIVGQTTDLLIPVADPEGDSVTLTSSELPLGAIIAKRENQYYLSWAPTEQQAGQSYTVTLIASDGTANSSAVISLIVEEPHSVTSVTPLPSFGGVPSTPNKADATSVKPLPTVKKVPNDPVKTPEKRQEVATTKIVEEIPTEKSKFTSPTRATSSNKIDKNQTVTKQKKGFTTVHKVVLALILGGGLSGVWLLIRKYKKP